MKKFYYGNMTVLKKTAEVGQWPLNQAEMGKITENVVPVSAELSIDRVPR